MDAVEIIGRHYAPASKSHRILLEHGRLVAEKALAAAARVPHLAPDLAFVESAALLHDIGIFLTDSPVLDCHGREPYIRHGILGREILEALGLPRHGLVCERHVGVGLSAEDIRRSGLPLPERDMRPVTVEEQIICYADKFFSKNGSDTPCEKSVAAIVASLRPYGTDKVERFMGWVELFG
ncbi:MAG: HD domain-containing protein [Deltaproteobacteria bacterium]|nr:HD domain-containing protein [Deltaproteobacteria bacterium]